MVGSLGSDEPPSETKDFFSSNSCREGLNLVTLLRKRNLQEGVTTKKGHKSFGARKPNPLRTILDPPMRLFAV